MASHGLPKLLGTSHGSMADPMAASINLIRNVLHLPAAAVFALGVALLEGIGGLLRAAGLATLMAVQQMLAIAYILGPTWVWINRGIEYVLLMLFLSVWIALRGAGRYPLERLFKGGD